MRVELHPEAEAEFAAEVRYYNEQEARLGERFYQEVVSLLERIADNSTLPRLRRDHRRVNLRVFPFYIAYAVEGSRIWVLAIAHAGRSPRYWRKRLQG